MVDVFRTIVAIGLGFLAIILFDIFIGILGRRK